MNSRVDGPHVPVESRHATGVTDQDGRQPLKYPLLSVCSHVEQCGSCLSVFTSSNRKTVCVVTDCTLVNLSTWTSLGAHQANFGRSGRNQTRMLHMSDTMLKRLKVCSVVGICALGGWCCALHHYTSVARLPRSFTICRRLTPCVQCLGPKRGDWGRCSSRDKGIAGRMQ
jgi:hypothetical protein